MKAKQDRDKRKNIVVQIEEVAGGVYRLETPIITAQYPAVAYIISQISERKKHQ